MDKLAHLFSEIEKAQGNQQLELLNNVKIAMGALLRSELAAQVETLNLEVLFQCLSSENGEEIQTTCEILKNLMTVLDPIACLDKYHESIIQGFNHPVPDVPALILQHLTRCIESNESCMDKYPALMEAVLNQIVSEDLKSAKEAERFLLKYGATASGNAYFLRDQTLASFKNLLNNTALNESKRFRVYEILTCIATISPQHLEVLNGSLGLLESLVKLCFKSDDLLGQTNALEILSTLVGCPHGQQGLKEAGVLVEIETLVGGLEDAPHGAILLPSVIKFIGKWGALGLPPNSLVDVVLQTLRNSGMDWPLQTVATEAFAFIGSTVEGKKCYKGLVDVKTYFNLFRGFVQEAPAEFRVRVLDAMAVLFGSDESNEDCLPHWFNILFHDMSELLEMTRLPFPELKIAALHLLSAIAHLDWSQRHYLRGPGVIEFLTSRQPEPVKEVVYAKFNLVKIIVDSPATPKNLCPENLARLKLYVHQGPFYAPAESTVATAGAGP